MDDSLLRKNNTREHRQGKRISSQGVESSQALLKLEELTQTPKHQRPVMNGADTRTALDGTSRSPGEPKATGIFLFLFPFPLHHSQLLTNIFINDNLIYAEDCKRSSNMPHQRCTKFSCLYTDMLRYTGGKTAKEKTDTQARMPLSRSSPSVPIIYRQSTPESQGCFREKRLLNILSVS